MGSSLNHFYAKTDKNGLFKFLLRYFTDLQSVGNIQLNDEEYEFSFEI